MADETLDAFCGSIFWDSNITWHTEDPDVTPCFQKTVLIWIPCTFLWAFAPLETYYILQSKTRNIPWNWLNISKLILNALLVVLCAVDVGFVANQASRGYDASSADHYAPVVKMLTFALAAAFLVYNRQRGLRTSGLLFLFWFLLAVFGIPQFRYEIRKTYNTPAVDPMYPFVSYMIYYPVVLALLFLNCFADSPPRFSEYPTDENPCPEQGASFLSKLFFAWFDRLAWTGFRKPLEMKDLWNINPEDTSREIIPVFEKHWRKSRQKAENVPGPKASFSKRSASVDFVSGKNKKKLAASVLPAICKAFGPMFLFGAMLKFVQDLLMFISPQILSLLIEFVNGDEPDWKGYLYAFLMLLTAAVQTLVLAQYFNRMFIVGLRVRTALISAIYRKALKMSNSARKESTVGEIVNLMSVDAQRFMDLTSYLNMIWSAPLQITLALYFLWGILGPSVLAGLLVMIVLIPLNAFIANQAKKLQIKQMKYKDERVKLMNEILSGMKVLKLYAWEPSFERQVLDVREKEVKVLKQSAYLNAGTSFIWSCAPFLVSLVTFATYILSDKENVLDAKTAFVSLAFFNIMRMPFTILPGLIVAMAQEIDPDKEWRKGVGFASMKVSLVTFAVFVLSSEDNILDAKVAFVSLSLFNILRFPLSMLPMLISNMVQASVSIKRMNKYMNSEELDPNNVTHEPIEKEPLVIENGTFTWDAEDPPSLKGINLKIKYGSLVAVVGTVGSGKSSLISAFLGEMEKLTGRVNTKGSIAYVPQQAWIQNDTLRDNIVFGKSLDHATYTRVVDSCALKPDFEMLPAGDQTEIGEKGINLSGGQKQRVSLARAVYNNADIYLLDDPLSAVDSHVGKHIFENVIGPSGMLKKKTRVLVTHGITFLPEVDHIVVLKDGEVSEQGTYKELLERKGAFAEFLLQHIQDMTEDENLNPDELGDLKEQLGNSLSGVEGDLKARLERAISRVSESHSDSGSQGDIRRSSSGSFQRQQSVESSNSIKFGNSDSIKKPNSDKENSVQPPVSGEKLIEAEKAETGSVKLRVYSHYLQSVGVLFSILTLLFNAIFQGFSIGSNVWLSVWSDNRYGWEVERNSSSPNSTSAPAYTNPQELYLGVYGGLGLGQVLMILIASLVLFVGALNAARMLHDLITSNILRTPLSFFDVTPIGRILNRFSKDVDVLDNTLPHVFRAWTNCFFSVVATLFVISYSTPIFIAVILPVGIIYYFIQRFYVATSRQLKRLESISKSPIYSHFGESITGAPTIRAYSVQERFIKESEEKVDVNQVCYYPGIIANRWLAVRLEMIGNIIIFFASLFAVLGRETMNPGLVGLSVSYALQITQTLNWLVRMTSDVETNIVAVERIKEYAEHKQEASWENKSLSVAADWPDTGKVEFKNYQVRYREGLDLVLKGISFTVDGGEKIGIVGRTGAGKSSLTLGLFRIIEAAGGSILIDGVDISKLGLHTLRSRLTIIPQDPVLFSGTLRINLDPFNTHSDDAIWKALEQAHLKIFVKGLAAGLNHAVSEGGENLSVGQRQLICLARALLRKTKVLVLDEATAAVDLETDDLIQRTIRTEFEFCTVLTIAHRLNTIMDSDRVIVLDKGLIVEFDTPSRLLQNKNSVFYGMAQDAGLA